LHASLCRPGWVRPDTSKYMDNQYQARTPYVGSYQLSFQCMLPGRFHPSNKKGFMWGILGTNAFVSRGWVFQEAGYISAIRLRPFGSKSSLGARRTPTSENDTSSGIMVINIDKGLCHPTSPPGHQSCLLSSYAPPSAIIPIKARAEISHIHVGQQTLLSR